MIAVGYDSEPNAGVVEQLHHAGIGRSLPPRRPNGPGERLRPGINLNEESRLAGVGIDDDPIGSKRFAVFRDITFKCLWNRLPLGDDIFVTERFFEDELDPRAMDDVGRSGTRGLMRSRRGLDRALIVAVDASSPFGEGDSQSSRVIGVVLVEPLRKGLSQHEDAEKRPRTGDERKPVVVVACDGHNDQVSSEKRWINYRKKR